MIIHPYTNSKNYQSTGATWSANSTNFPACKLFFPCNEIAASTTLVDTQQYATLAVASLTRTTNTFGIKTTSGAKTTTGTSITLDAPFFLFAVCDGGGTYPTITIGGASGGTQIALNTGGPSITDGTSGAVATGTIFTLNTASNIYGRANVLTAFNSSTGQTTYEFTTTSTASALANTATDVTSAGGVALTNPLSSFNFGASGWNPSSTNGIYGIAFFKFATIPTNLKSGLAWMTYQWSIGNKWLYPAWKGVS